ncbi:hypothetical protein RvY_05157-2 [Ramazzottius varieornatus]|uniref:Uncharacterized protein n=1 Tax=Ramazzottius varieornatus TaxID=947166 RepID=A0A1D1UU56_RAMVA|nr:hypothetical protein RvY_05157-2 [Ramazzottius varieornatus]
MSRYLLRDVQAVLRGVRKVAESSLKLETEKVSLRLGDFRSQPSLRSVPASLTSRSQAFSLQEIAARAGVVLRGVQQQFRNVTGVNAAPVVAFDNGSVLYSERIHSQSSQKQAPTTVPTGSVSNSPQPEGKANEAAERAKQFMNPPVAPMDPVDKNEFVAMPEMGRSNGNGENKQAADFMKNQGDTDMDSQYAPDSSKNTKSVPTKEIVAEDGSMSIEDIKKATQIRVRHYSSQAGKRPDKEPKKVAEALEHQTVNFFRPFCKLSAAPFGI